MASATTTLMVDGREIEVPAGATILDAARRLGIPIPTLCHVEGLEPASSCFLCCVQVEGHKGALSSLFHAGFRGHGGHDEQRRCAGLTAYGAGAAALGSRG